MLLALGGKLIVTGKTLLVGWLEYLAADALDALARFGTAGASLSVSSGEAFRLDVDGARLGGMMGLCVKEQRPRRNAR